MIRRITIAVIAASLISSIAHGQMRYSRERKPSPTPTPTPQQLIPAQKGTSAPQTTPAATPLATSQQRMIYPQMQPKPTPTPALKSAFAPRPTPSPLFQPKPSPTPLQKIPYGQVQSQVPAQRTFTQQPSPTPIQTRIPGQRTFAPQQPSPSPIQSRISGQRTMAAPQPGTTSVQPRIMATPAPTPAKPTPTPVPPPDVKAYVDKQAGNSKDKKFHMTVNGKDLPLTPFHFWAARSSGFNTTTTHIDMRGDDGRVYDIEFATTGAQISSIRIHRINGEVVR